MSELFEGVLCLCTPTEFEEAVRVATAAAGPRARRPRTKVRAVAPRLSAVYAANPRPEGSFAKEMASLAAELSLPLGKALFVLYDNRVGVRLSAMFADGDLVAEYDAEDEIFVPLDENGEPQLLGPRLKPAELDPEQEYDTVMNAVQRGLKDLGEPGAWPLVRELISGQ
jgi:hypothetical protein